MDQKKHCICQDEHRRGYCTEPTCPYRIEQPEIREFKNSAGKVLKLIMKPGAFRDYR